MYCVIQEISKKKKINGYPKELLSKHVNSSLMRNYYYYYYSEERFIRLEKPSYRISIHESYRENGKVKKRQYVICTVDYYDFATSFFTLYDWGDRKISIAADFLQADIEMLYDMIEEKIKPLQESIIKEFQLTEEYITHKEHDKITTLYAVNKTKFNDKYSLSGNEYDQCYDVFGNLMNPERLKEIEQEFVRRQEYERDSSSYYKKYYDNHSDSGYSSESGYFNSGSDNYNSQEKDMLKQFYRALSKKYHPDANRDIDTSKEMQLLNKLKGNWGI